MFKLSDKKMTTILIIVAIMSIIATYIVSVCSNRPEISREALAMLDETERKSSITSQVGSVNIKYVDVNGKEIASADSITGNIGSEYRASRKAIPTYVPYGAEPYNKAGNFEKDTKDVIFVYEKEDTSVEVSEENNTVTVKTLHERNTKEYDVKIITKDENGNLIKGVSYNVTDSEGKTIRNGKVQGDTFVAGTLTVTDEGRDTYKIEEDTRSYYEKLEERAIEFSLTKSWNSDLKEYEVSLDYPKDYNGVTFEFKDDEIIITIINKEKEPKNVFDLEIDKYVKKVVVKENDKIEKEYITNTNNNDNLIKIDIAKQKLDTTKIEVTYGIVVKNVGNVSGYATEITDYLPEGFKYLSGGNWVVDGNNMKTEDLKEIELAPGETIDIEIVTEWTLGQDNIGLRENRVEITDYQNELDLEDKTPDNVGSASIISTVKTGGAQIPVGIILLILNVSLVSVYMIKRIRKGKCRNEK